MPESFDLRNVDTDGDGNGDRCFVTPVRLQNPFGTCWGFAAIAAAEISILGNNLKNDPDAWKTLDLSEKQLAYFTNVPLNDPDNPQKRGRLSPAHPVPSHPHHPCCHSRAQARSLEVHPAHALQEL